MSRSRRKKSGFYPCGSKDCGWCRKDELKRAQRCTATKEQQEALAEMIRLNVEMGLYENDDEQN